MTAVVATPRAPSAALLPRSGVLLIGTHRSITRLRSQLAELDECPILSGCLLLDGPDPSGSGFSDLPVLGASPGPGELAELAARLHLKVAIISVPRSLERRQSALAESCRAAGLEVRTVPVLEDLLGPQPPARITRPAGQTPAIDLARLINRTPHDLNRDAVAQVLTGKRILITGAGGSIGSELARVAASFQPSQLILMERGENALFEIDRQLSERFPGVPRKAVLHDVVDAEATLDLLDRLRPHTVFHAAAHKHVPLMEDHPAHAVANNLFGTKSIADAAVACASERFVMISSDKAVNPTSVMGATKRLAEMYVHGLGRRAGPTRLSMVRFGNVLGSAASVLTIWSQQLAEGGPITVTDPRMTRYFMTIPEAATLVIESTTLRPQTDASGRHGVGVFVLDMGKPIPIAELAVRYIQAHGVQAVLKAADLPENLRHLAHTPEGAEPSIDVVFTGARPGEKLHEELAYAAEALRPTAHPGIRAWGGGGFEPSVAQRVDSMVRAMSAARFGHDRHNVLSLIRAHVPEMRPPTPPAATSTHPNVG